MKLLGLILLVLALLCAGGGLWRMFRRQWAWVDTKPDGTKVYDSIPVGPITMEQVVAVVAGVVFMLLAVLCLR